MRLLILLAFALQLSAPIGNAGEVATVKQARALMRKHPRTLVLDVRTPREFDSIHLRGSVNIPLQSKSFIDRVKALPNDLSVLIVCARGRRSATAMGLLDSLGFTKVAHLQGGLEAWCKAKLPVISAKQ
jgi:rhodanese-related sulfurtransferase